MNHSKTVLFALALIAMLSSCKSQYDTLLNSNDVDAKYSAAFEYFNQGKYQKSARLFESLSSQTNGTAKDDTVQYYWGLSNYRFKDYYTAETNFETFLDNYPRSAFAREATFLRIDCLYRSTYRYELDQMPTNKAIAAILEYMVEDTEGTHTEVCQHMLDDLNDRLDRKAYENAKLYYKMEDYLASRIALRNVLKEDADNAYREDVLYYIAMSSFKYANLSVAEKQKDRFMTFVDDYYNFISEYEESKYRRELDVLYTRAQRALGKFTGSDEDLKVKEKDFEKERKQLEKAAKEK